MQRYRRSRKSLPNPIPFSLLSEGVEARPVGKVKERLEQVMYQAADGLGIEVLKLAINPDHIHLFASAHPTMPVHKIVRRIKGRSSNILRREFPELLKLPSL